MSRKELTTALTLYRGGVLTLSQAARRGDVSTAEVTAALESRGIPVRDADAQAVGRTAD